MRCEAPAIGEGAIIAANVENLVLLAFLGRGKRNLAVVGLALLLSCCTNERETKILLGIPDTVEQTPDTDADRGIFACRQYGFVPGTQQWDECMKYVDPSGRLCRDPSTASLSTSSPLSWSVQQSTALTSLQAIEQGRRAAAFRRARWRLISSALSDTPSCVVCVGQPY